MKKAPERIKEKLYFTLGYRETLQTFCEMVTKKGYKFSDITMTYAEDYDPYDRVTTLDWFFVYTEPEEEYQKRLNAWLEDPINAQLYKDQKRREKEKQLYSALSDKRRLAGQLEQIECKLKELQDE